MEVPLTDAQYIPNVGLNTIFNMLNELLMINVWGRTVPFIFFVNIFFFWYLKVALTVRERRTKTKQSEDRLPPQNTLKEYVECNDHSSLLY